MDSFDRSIRNFVKIAELESLTRAADELELSQSGISRQLASLEAYVGKPLFSRTGRGVELTAVGKRLFDVAQLSYANIDEVVEAIREREGITEGAIRVAVVHTLSYYFLSDVVAEFVAQRTNVNLSIISRSSPEVVALVQSGKADVGFVYDAAVDIATLQITPLFDDDMCVFARTDVELPDVVDLSLVRQKFIGFPPHYALRKMLQGIGLTLDFVAEAETVDAMLRLVSFGIGVCVLPSRIPDKLLIEYGLKKLSIIRPLLRRRVVAIVRDQKYMPPLIKEVVEIAVTKAK